MASGSYRQADVVCPFYVSDDGRKKIRCEGIEKNTLTETIFRGAKARDTYMVRYCCSACWTKCHIGRAIGEKYMDEK